MSKRRQYIWGYDHTKPFGKGPIFLQHYNDPGFRTHVLSTEEFEQLTSYEFCKHMNNAYEEGYKHAMEDLRRLIGVRD